MGVRKEGWSSKRGPHESANHTAGSWLDDLEVETKDSNAWLLWIISTSFNLNLKYAHNQSHQVHFRLLRTPIPPNPLNLTLCQNAHFPSPLIALLPTSSLASDPLRICFDATSYVFILLHFFFCFFWLLYLFSMLMLWSSTFGNFLS